MNMVAVRAESIILKDYAVNLSEAREENDRQTCCPDGILHVVIVMGLYENSVRMLLTVLIQHI